MRKYYYSQGSDRRGPLMLDELRALNLPKGTLIWYQGLSQWVDIEEVEELRSQDTKDDASEEQPPVLPNKRSLNSPYKARFMPYNWMVPSLILTFLFLPLGVFPLIFSSQVEKRYYNQDFIGAERAANRAKIAVIIGFILLFISLILVLSLILGLSLIGMESITAHPTFV